MNNKRGIVVLYGIMLGMVIVILALALAPAVSVFTDNARAVTVGDTLGMNCVYTNNISTFVRAACIATDMTLFYFVSFLILLGGAVVTAKMVFGGEEQ